jgi:hypothetical protein
VLTDPLSPSAPLETTTLQGPAGQTPDDQLWSEVFGPLTPVAAATTTTLASSADPSVPGQTVTYTATVSPTDDSGTVAFSDGATPIPGCTAQSLDTKGQATCQVTYTATGSHTMTAVYSGDSAYAGSPSAPLTQQVVPNRADLKVAVSAPAQAADGTALSEKVTVTNQGPATANKVVTALVEPGALAVTNADGANVKGPVLIWSMAGLAPGASQTFTVIAQTGTHAHGTVVVTAGTLSATPDPNIFNNAAAARISLGL